MVALYWNEICAAVWGSKGRASSNCVNRRNREFCRRIFSNLFRTFVDFLNGLLYNYKKVTIPREYDPFSLGGRIDKITVISYGLGKRFGI